MKINNDCSNTHKHNHNRNRNRLQIHYNISTILPYKKTDWLINIIASLPEKWNKHLVSLDDDYPVNIKNSEVTYLFKHFNDEISHDELIKEEKWLGTPFNKILDAYKKEYTYNNYVYIANLVRFWRLHFEINKINLFIGRMEAYPNDYVSMLVCKRMNIKFVSFCVKFLNNVMLIDEHGSPYYWKEVTEQDKEEALLYFDNCKEEFNNTFKQVNNKRNNYFDVLDDFIGKFFMSKYRVMEATNLITSIKKYLSSFYNKDKVRDYFTSYTVSAADSDYIYYVLHYKYETYLYREYPYVNEYQLLMEVLKNTPLGVNVYYRNHPAYKGADADLEMLDKIHNYPNARYIDFNVNSKELLLNSKFVIGIFSTALLECIILKKPAIVLFDKSYHVEGVNLYVNNIKDLPDSINYLLNNKMIINENNRKQFLGKMYKHFIPLNGNITRFGPDFTKEGCKGIADAIKELVSCL